MQFLVDCMSALAPFPATDATKFLNMFQGGGKSLASLLDFFLGDICSCCHQSLSIFR